MRGNRCQCSWEPWEPSPWCSTVPPGWTQDLLIYFALTHSDRVSVQVDFFSPNPNPVRVSVGIQLQASVSRSAWMAAEPWAPSEHCLFLYSLRTPRQDHSFLTSVPFSTKSVFLLTFCKLSHIVNAVGELANYKNPMVTS